MKFSDWLDKKYLEWQTQAGRRNTLTAFAKYLGISQSLLSRYLNDDVTPSLEKAQTMSEKLGPEIFNVIGLAPPDPILQYVNRHWHELNEDRQNEIREQVEKYLAANRKESTHPTT